MGSSPPPFAGHNNNVRYQGRVFHIQTEDSGVRHARIVTHLFSDCGQIVQSARCTYAEAVGRPNLETVVRRLMKDQHLAMLAELRAGKLDPVIARLFGSSAAGPPRLTPGLARTSVEPLVKSTSSGPRGTISNASPRPRTSSKPPRASETVVVPSSGASGRGSNRPRSGRPPPSSRSSAATGRAKSEGPPRKRTAPGRASSERPPRPDPSRSVPAAEPQRISRPSLFDDGTSNQSLDEAILGYLGDAPKPR